MSGSVYDLLQKIIYFFFLLVLFINNKFCVYLLVFIHFDFHSIFPLKAFGKTTIQLRPFRYTLQLLSGGLLFDSQLIYAAT